ncbi:MAG: MAPEG family protein [Pseudomonadota bacterium]
MTPELVWLTLSALLAASLWIPYIVGVNTEPTTDDTAVAFRRPPDLRTMRPWVHRSWRAHQNLLETLIPFAAVVLIANMAGVSTQVTIWATIAFFWLRVAHAAGMISGLTGFPVRPIIFTASWLCTIAIGVQLLVGAPSL